MKASKDDAPNCAPASAAKRRIEPLHQPTYMEAWRKKLDLKIDEAAAIVGRHRSTLERIEQGKFKTGYNQSIVELLAKAFQITPLEVLFRDPQDATDPIGLAILASTLGPRERRFLARLILALKEEATTP